MVFPIGFLFRLRDNFGQKTCQFKYTNRKAAKALRAHKNIQEILENEKIRNPLLLPFSGELHRHNKGQYISFVIHLKYKRHEIFQLRLCVF